MEAALELATWKMEEMEDPDRKSLECCKQNIMGNSGEGSEHKKEN